MTVEELLQQIVKIKHTMRIWDHLADTLRGFLDQDIGTAKILEAEGCLVQHVPKSEIATTLDEIYEKLEFYSGELKKLERYHVQDPYKKPKGGKKVAEAPAPVVKPAPIAKKKPGPKPKAKKGSDESGTQPRSAVRKATS